MNIDNFPFDKFYQYRNIKLIKKCVKFLFKKNSHDDINEVINVFIKLGYIRVSIDDIEMMFHNINGQNIECSLYIADNKCHVMSISTIESYDGKDHWSIDKNIKPTKMR